MQEEFSVFLLSLREVPTEQMSRYNDVYHQRNKEIFWITGNKNLKKTSLLSMTLSIHIVNLKVGCSNVLCILLKDS